MISKLRLRLREMWEGSGFWGRVLIALLVLLSPALAVFVTAYFLFACGVVIAGIVLFFVVSGLFLLLHFFLEFLFKSKKDRINSTYPFKWS